MNPILKTGLPVLALAAATAAGAEGLGRLFFTPEQRTQLEYNQRQGGDTTGNARTLTVNGIVQKHGGGRTVWINGIPQFAEKSEGRAAESQPLTVPGQPQPVKIKVGQKVLIDPPAPGQ